jgi:nucleotide-binding universal stress UspA family protein
MKTIIVLTDFSPLSLNAANYAIDMAAELHASITLFHAYTIPLAYNEIPIAPDTTQLLVDGATEQMKNLKEKLSADCGGKTKIYTEIVMGSVIPQLQDYCAKIKPIAVVMSPRGAGAVERFFLGSNTIYAIKHLVWPLIVVPAEARFSNIKKIGLACDLKNVVETSPIEEIKDLVKQFHAKLYVLHVNTGSERSYGPEIIEESGLLQEMLQELHPKYHFLNDIDIEAGISDFAEKNKLDLVIVIPKKRNLIEKIFNKSHTKSLALHTRVPLMAMHE